jgi:hypothetical protein
LNRPSGVGLLFPTTWISALIAYEDLLRLPDGRFTCWEVGAPQAGASGLPCGCWKESAASHRMRVRLLQFFELTYETDSVGCLHFCSYRCLY